MFHSGRITVLLWSPAGRGFWKLWRKAQRLLQTQGRVLHWPQTSLIAASSSWPTLMRRSTEASETLPSSPHQVRYTTNHGGHLSDFIYAWPHNLSSLSVSPSLLSESDVPHVILVCESLHHRGGRGYPDGVAHAPYDGAGRHPRPCCTGSYSVTLKAPLCVSLYENEHELLNFWNCEILFRSDQICLSCRTRENQTLVACAV